MTAEERLPVEERQYNEELVIIKDWHGRSARAVSEEEAAAIQEESLETKVVKSISNWFRNVFSGFVIGAAIAASVLVPIVAEAVADQVTRHQERQKQKA